MILRESVLSTERIRLGMAEEHVAREPENHNLALAAYGAESPPPAPATTLSDVLHWLQSQDAAARQVLAQALDTEIASARAMAEQSGYREGLAQGQAAVEEKIAADGETLSALMRNLEAAFEAELETLRESCAEVVMAAIGKIVGPLFSNRNIAIMAVLEVLKRVKDERELTIRVSEGDLAALESHRDTIESALRGRIYSLKPDSRVEAGGCVVETKLGSLDGRVEVQLREMLETIAAAKRGAKA